MICIAADSNGHLITENSLLNGKCQNLVAVNQTEFELSYAQITSAEIVTDITFGFGIIITFWFFGYVIGVAKNVIKQL